MKTVNLKLITIGILALSLILFLIYYHSPQPVVKTFPVIAELGDQSKTQELTIDVTLRKKTAHGKSN